MKFCKLLNLKYQEGVLSGVSRGCYITRQFKVSNSASDGEEVYMRHLTRVPVTEHLLL